MKVPAIDLKKGNEVKSGNVVCTIISVNDKFSTDKVVCFNAIQKATTIKRKGGFYKSNSISETETTIYFRNTTLIEIRN